MKPDLQSGCSAPLRHLCANRYVDLAACSADKCHPAAARPVDAQFTAVVEDTAKRSCEAERSGVNNDQVAVPECCRSEFRCSLRLREPMHVNSATEILLIWGEGISGTGRTSPGKAEAGPPS